MLWLRKLYKNIFFYLLNSLFSIADTSYHKNFEQNIQDYISITMIPFCCVH